MIALISAEGNTIIKNSPNYLDWTIWDISKIFFPLSSIRPNHPILGSFYWPSYWPCDILGGGIPSSRWEESLDNLTSPFRVKSNPKRRKKNNVRAGDLSLPSHAEGIPTTQVLREVSKKKSVESKISTNFFYFDQIICSQPSAKTTESIWYCNLRALNLHA